MTFDAPKRLGYYFNEKKLKKLSIPEIEDALREVNIEPVQVDLLSSLVPQGQFDAILHKLTDVILQADEGDIEAKNLLENLKAYSKLHPKVTIIDEIETIRVLTDRLKTYTIAESCQFQPEGLVFIPPFVTLQSECVEENRKLLRMSKVTFPVGESVKKSILADMIVCKPIIAHGSKAHGMTLVFNEEGLMDCSYPCVVQSFVNHEGVIFKIFSIGDQSFIVERTSITNLTLPKDFPSIHFHSSDIEQANLSIRQKMAELGIRFQSEKPTVIQPSTEVLQCISRTIGHEFKIGLFGVDVVVDSITRKYAIIDINAFPAYTGVENFPRILAEYIRKRLDSRGDL